VTKYGLADDGRAEYWIAMDGVDTPGSVQYSYDASNRLDAIDTGAAGERRIDSRQDASLCALRMRTMVVQVRCLRHW